MLNFQLHIPENYKEVLKNTKLRNICLLLIAFFCLILRNTDPLRNPIVYAEDGLWAGNILTNGFFYTLLHAKQGYFAFGNIILIGFSILLSFIFSKSQIFLLPESIATVSFLYYAIVGTLLFIAIEKIYNTTTALAVYLGYLLIPAGGTLNETFGRLLQIGFHAPLMFASILVIRTYINSLLFKTILDFILLICILTNPLCLIFLIIPFIHEAYLLKEKANQPSELILLVIKKNIGLIIIAATSLLMLLGNTVPKTGYGFQNLNINQIIMAIIGRSITYPFIFLIYPYINNGIAMIFAIFIYWGIVQSINFQKGLKKIFLIEMLLLATLCNLISAYMRPYQIISLLKDYHCTFPDRYFLLQNLLYYICGGISIITFIQQNYSPIKAKLGKIIIVLLLMQHLMQIGLIIPLSPPLFPFNEIGTFRQNLINNYSKQKNNNIAIPIYPPSPDWKMVVPENVHKDALAKAKNTNIYK